MRLTESPQCCSSKLAIWLLHTELHCAANRHPGDIDPDSVGIVLDTVSLVDVTRGDPLRVRHATGAPTLERRHPSGRSITPQRGRDADLRRRTR